MERPGYYTTEALSLKKKTPNKNNTQQQQLSQPSKQNTQAGTEILNHLLAIVRKKNQQTQQTLSCWAEHSRYKARHQKHKLLSLDPNVTFFLFAVSLQNIYSVKFII